MKTIICIEGVSAVGKTCTVKNVRKLLNPKEVKPETGFTVEEFKEESKDGDFYAILSHKETGKKIGLSSSGDPYSNQGEYLEYLAKESCDIILCASRTKGDTTSNVYEIAEMSDYEIIKTRNFRGDAFPNKASSDRELSREDLNSEFAQAVVRLINLLIKKS